MSAAHSERGGTASPNVTIMPATSLVNTQPGAAVTWNRLVLRRFECLRVPAASDDDVISEAHTPAARLLATGRVRGPARAAEDALADRGAPLPSSDRKLDNTAAF